uniref:Uncharacterized protein n=1 Tax=Lepeophtheirus salmonis TaxID=72036 RepID=A0A0K2VCW2_LEPSM
MRTLWEIGFTFVALSIDNHTVNIKLYIHHLCGGNLQTSIPHTKDSSKRVHLIIDIVHNFKTFINVFRKGKTWYVQIFTFLDHQLCAPTLPKSEKINMLESTFKVKQAHKLSLKALNPTSIKKTSVKLADTIFHEFTIFFNTLMENSTERKIKLIKRIYYLQLQE